GISATRWLVGGGARVTVSEIKAESELDSGLTHKIRQLGAILETGAHREETFSNSDLIILSPGVPLDIAPLEAAREKGVPIMGEMELAARLMDVPIVAVTGTNGKSTVTAFLSAMLKKAGFKVFVGGNIGTPLMDYAARNWQADYAVVEVSSFQLDTMETFCPFISLLLNISPDHLDRYPSYEAYVHSKLRVVENQRQGHYAIFNDDDPALSGFRPSGGVSVLRYGSEKRENRQAFMDGKRIVALIPGMKACSFDLEKCALPGGHNLENLMGAVLGGLALHVEPRIIQETIASFQGLPHRLELVARIRGVEFYNDSKATNVEAASRSVASFDRPVILIAGGRHKGSDYSPLVKVAKGRVKKAVFLGEAKDLLAQAFKGVILFSFADSMEDAVYQASSSAMPQDVVLLAPACSSFDMFSDYAERGDTFKEAVKRFGHESEP
ncbi:MAG: UDP-N-acetylmuramoyl-L-alanine--D-glutamate ligase, partial [Desulfobacteraceae bacterium]